MKGADIVRVKGNTLRHERYMPVLDRRTLMGVISFHGVTKAVVDARDFENRMLKACIRDWPAEADGAQAATQGRSGS